MRNINEQTLLGHLGANPEVRHMQSTSVASLSVATSTKWRNAAQIMQERTEWHRVILWGAMALYAEKYAEKGQAVYVVGETRHRSWQKQDGSTGYAVEVHAREFIILTAARGKPAGELPSGPQSEEKPLPPSADQEPPEPAPYSDQEVPF